MDNFEYIKSKDISVAPMMDWTDRHCRYFLRLISPHIKLYTEMVTCGALIHGDIKRHLEYNAEEHPIALQLGGSDAKELAHCTKLAKKFGYDEVNLNCGCPSDRVQKGAFGACLMKDPTHVAKLLQSMKEASDIPVSVKCRIGVDEFDSYEFLCEFIDTIAQTGVNHFIVHARKAWLKGLSPKENRSKPPLNFRRVAKIKEQFPHCRIVVNGEIQNISQAQEKLENFDGIMIGRAAYQNPWFLHEIEKTLFSTQNLNTREEIIHLMEEYLHKELKRVPEIKVNSITRHMMGLFKGKPGGAIWRRALSTYPHNHSTALETLSMAQHNMFEAIKNHEKTQKAA